jgi:hypothetical protein
VTTTHPAMVHEPDHVATNTQSAVLHVPASTVVVASTSPVPDHL